MTTQHISHGAGARGGGGAATAAGSPGEKYAGRQHPIDASDGGEDGLPDADPHHRVPLGRTCLRRQPRACPSAAAPRRCLGQLAPPH